jgi:hypothetical protein
MSLNINYGKFESMKNKEEENENEKHQQYFPHQIFMLSIHVTLHKNFISLILQETR